MVTKTIVKQKAKTKTAVTSEEATQIDTYGSLFEKVDAAKKKLKPFEKELESLGVPLLERADLEDKTEGFVLTGESHIIEFGAKGITTEITDLKEVVRQLRAVDTDLPWKLMKFNIGDLEKYLTPDTLDKLIAKDNTKKRRVKVEKRAKVQA